MRVFKYRSGSSNTLRRDIRSLYRNEIYAAPIDSLNDLFEARVTVNGETFNVGLLLSNLGLINYTYKIKEAEAKFLSALRELLVTAKRWGVYSLSKTAFDELLWAYYGDSHRGFCIEYELDQLISYKLEAQSRIAVAYHDAVPEIGLSDLSSLGKSHEQLATKLIGTKSKRWSHESEIRVVTGDAGLYEYDFRAVKSIYFGARSSANLRRRIMRAMAGRGLDYYEVRAEGETYRLKRVVLPDQFGDRPRYRSRCAPIEDGVPYWDDTISPHRASILKAMEIVRREPYCERVVDAYLSQRGTAENPVYYVTYERSDGQTRNHHISQSELDSYRSDA